MPSSDQVTIYVGQAGEKYSDPEEWRELIRSKRLARATLIPVRRGGVLQHLQAHEVPELAAVFNDMAEGPSVRVHGSATPPKSGPVLELKAGANAPVDPDLVSLVLTWSASTAGLEIDGSAFLVDGVGKVRSDADMIFYNQASSACGAVKMLPAPSAAHQVRFDVDLPRVPAAVERIVLCLTIVEAAQRSHTFGQAGDVGLLLSSGTGQPILRFAPNLAGAREAALIIGELYRRQGAWRFRAVGQGFNGGLGPLARTFGVDVSDE